MDGFDGADYQARFDQLEKQGVDVHGEAALIRRFSPATVLDAGCGTGRVAIELARHGVDVVGVDVDHSMIEEARRRGPSLDFIEHDLATMDLGRTFDLVVLAGNVPLFCRPRNRSALVERCAAHARPGGLVIVGFELGRGYEIDQFDRHALAAALVLDSRWSTWDGQIFEEQSTYAVSIFHRESI